MDVDVSRTVSLLPRCEATICPRSGKGTNIRQNCEGVGLESECSHGSAQTPPGICDFVWLGPKQVPNRNYLLTTTLAFSGPILPQDVLVLDQTRQKEWQKEINHPNNGSRGRKKRSQMSSVWSAQFVHIIVFIYRHCEQMVVWCIQFARAQNEKCRIPVISLTPRRVAGVGKPWETTNSALSMSGS